MIASHKYQNAIRLPACSLVMLFWFYVNEKNLSQKITIINLLIIIMTSLPSYIICGGIRGEASEQNAKSEIKVTSIYES